MSFFPAPLEVIQAKSVEITGTWSFIAKVEQDGELVSVRRKTAVYLGDVDPAYIERGALVIHPETGSKDLDRTKLAVIDKDLVIQIESDSPIRIVSAKLQLSQPKDVFEEEFDAVFETGSSSPDATGNSTKVK